MGARGIPHVARVRMGYGVIISWDLKVKRDTDEDDDEGIGRGDNGEF